MVAQQGFIKAAHDPGDVCLGKALTQGGQDRKAVHDVTEGARLYERELRLKEEALQAQSAGKTDIGWGHQIRSYVLQPYQMVKDTRTGVERGNAMGVLDGDIDCFLEAALAMRIGGMEQEK